MWGCELSQSGVSGCGEESTLSLFWGCFVVDLSIPGAKLLLPAALASAEQSILGDLKAAFCFTFCTVGSLGFVILSQGLTVA